VRRRFAPDIEREFIASRIAGLVAVNSNTFWSIAVVVLGFSAWDWFADPANWLSAFWIRVTGTALIVATGLFQKLPGKANWLPFMAKVRLVTAVVTAFVAALMLDRGYGYGVAGMVVIILTGPYVAIDGRDLFATNVAVVVAVTMLMITSPLSGFDIIGTMVFVLLAIAASTLLGRVIEASNRRAFMLDLELHRDARTDSLTGLDNRRAMEERGPIEMKRAQRFGRPVSLVLCDLDHFKAINDKHGHEAGDAALRTVARVLRGALRETDMLGRWGGEEFMAVLADTNARPAIEVAERMRAAVNSAKFDDLPGGATISLGVATIDQVTAPGAAWDSLIKEADQLLYQAKKEGRNRVIYTQA
jgi:diguanylate cyclase (GGDEF)-like protein